MLTLSIQGFLSAVNLYVGRQSTRNQLFERVWTYLGEETDPVKARSTIDLMTAQVGMEGTARLKVSLCNPNAAESPLIVEEV